MLDRIKAARAYKNVFLNKEGQLSPEARVVLNDLYRFARFFQNAPADPQALAVVEGARSVVRHILKRTGRTGAEMTRNINETITGESYD